MAAPFDPFAVLTTPPPAFDVDTVARRLQQAFNLRGQLSPLDSERDQNFRLDSEDGRILVVKIANSAELADVTAFQAAALEHIARVDPGFPSPRGVCSLDGDAVVRLEDASGLDHRLRVIRWLDGEVMGGSNAKSLAHSMGTLLARLDLALQTFTHPGDKVPLLWDVSNAGLVAPQVATIDNAALRRRCEQQFEIFAAEVAPLLRNLRQQVVHNDFNPGNVLVDPANHDRIAGIIDFGDMVRAPLIVEVATAAAYLAMNADDPRSEIDALIAAYQESIELHEEELALVDRLIRTRLVVSITIAHWRARQFPENRRYIMITQQASIRLLDALDDN